MYEKQIWREFQRQIIVEKSYMECWCFLLRCIRGIRNNRMNTNRNLNSQGDRQLISQIPLFSGIESTSLISYTRLQYFLN